jgi:periplasmic glucans biosynthesis protein
MFRRTFLRKGAAIATALWPGVRTFAENASAPISRGSGQPFSYPMLKEAARALASASYQPQPEKLPPLLANLTWDQWEAIRFRDEHALWAGEGLRFQAKFFHLGLEVKTPVRLFTVDAGLAQEITYAPALFDFSRSGIDGGKLPTTLGFAGFRLCFYPDWIRDVAAFQNHSYFRAVDGDKQYGLSHRGLAIDCGMPTPEEFPYFIAYYLQRPQKDSSRLDVYGLLDSPSVAGAYHFTIDAADTLTMDIDAALYPRKQIERLGVAPGTSMFLCGSNDRRVGADLRPQIHDSDGLQLNTGANERIWRPLVNPGVVRVNTFNDENPRGFGLMQRDHNFDHYQDDGAFYDKRPSGWVEPRGKWGKGAVVLVELPAAAESVDNIVAFWTPADKPQRGQELLFSYRLHWCRENPFPSPLATVQATRTGVGGLVAQPHSYFSWRFEVDFQGKELASMNHGVPLTPVISASRGVIELASARPLASINGWRALFDLKLTDDSVEPINLRLVLASAGRPVTETWFYQYTPPPPDRRRI